LFLSPLTFSLPRYKPCEKDFEFRWVVSSQSYTPKECPGCRKTVKPPGRLATAGLLSLFHTLHLSSSSSLSLCSGLSHWISLAQSIRSISISLCLLLDCCVA